MGDKKNKTNTNFDNYVELAGRRLAVQLALFPVASVGVAPVEQETADGTGAVVFHFPLDLNLLGRRLEDVQQRWCWRNFWREKNCFIFPLSTVPNYVIPMTIS